MLAPCSVTHAHPDRTSRSVRHGRRSGFEGAKEGRGRQAGGERKRRDTQTTTKTAERRAVGARFDSSMEIEGSFK